MRHCPFCSFLPHATRYFGTCDSKIHLWVFSSDKLWLLGIDILPILGCFTLVLSNISSKSQEAMMLHALVVPKPVFKLRE